MTLEERGIGLEAEQEPANRLVVRLAALELLGDRVHVPEPALEGAPLGGLSRLGCSPQGPAFGQQQE